MCRARVGEDMKLGRRSRLSLCQFLTLFGRGELVLLLGKYGFPTDELENEWAGAGTAGALKDVVVQASASQLEGLVQELARTQYSMRIGISPRYRFDERWTDLRLCLELDGYAWKRDRDEFGIEQDRFVSIEPNIEGAATVEDELTGELRRSGLPDVEGIVQVLDGSASAFRNSDFNGCLNNARVALQTLATSIARERLREHAGSFDERKWGQVIAYLRSSGLITQQQEQGLAGVFGLISPGSHTPIGFDDEEFARLGRGLAVSVIYFLVKRLNAHEA